MFAIGFDLLWQQTKATHPKGVSQAYADIGAVLNRYGFTRVQGSVYVSQGDSLVDVTLAMNALKALPWFSTCVRDVRAFKVEHWSDFTNFMKT
ncbi:virulence factor [Sphingomonas sp.]|uniref:virulence factor n=1 Tax=Sphingomonas sp. TaxID=28214 RepID=UPI002D810BC9|nr:virulence factor [Sphingomonas sp.]HEU0043885.1 virulence factor [Sphingomonas sp.]